MQRLTPIDPAEAEGKAKSLLDGVQRSLGMTPNLMRVMANSPAVLDAYIALNKALSGGVLDAKTREAIALTVAGANGCDYCASAHTAIASMLGVPRGELSANLEGRSDDPKLDVILKFVTAVVAKRGWVSDQEIAVLRTVGLSDGEIAEIVAGVGANFFSNIFDHVTRPEIDFPLVETARGVAA